MNETAKVAAAEHPKVLGPHNATLKKILDAALDLPGPHSCISIHAGDYDETLYAFVQAWVVANRTASNRLRVYDKRFVNEDDGTQHHYAVIYRRDDSFAFVHWPVEFAAIDADSAEAV